MISNKLHSNIFYVLIAVATLVYITAAWYNVGYHHADEHYQLIEFSGLKLGWNSEKNLAWEYHSMIRPTFQVWVCYLILGSSQAMGVADPYVLSFILRLITAFLVIIGICLFYKRSKFMLPTNSHFIYACLSFFIWFIPSISVRFSSETWSGILFMMGLSFLLGEGNYNKRDSYLAGIFTGLSFLCRFQTGFMIVGMIAWLIFVKKYSFSKLANVIVPILVVIQIGVALDSLFYGEYVVTFWKYFKANILDDVASNYGVSPWWTILIYLIKQPLLPIGILILLSYIIIAIGSVKSPVIWCTLPFILVHTLIPHKELRFLFPLVWFIPFTIMLGFTQVLVLKRFFTAKYLRLAKVGTFGAIGILGIMNTVALVQSISSPAGYSQKWLTKKIRDDFNGTPVKLLHTSYGNPFEPWPILDENFYKEENISYQKIDYWKDLEKYVLASSDTTYLLGIRRFDNLTIYTVPMDSLYIKELYTTDPSMDIYTFGLMDDRNTNYFIIYAINRKHEQI